MSRAIKNTVLLKVSERERRTESARARAELISNRARTRKPPVGSDRHASLSHTLTPPTHNQSPYTTPTQREDLQPVFSFKLRGAYNKIVSTPPADLERGVVACSAGNHAQVRDYLV
jgi:hypothetical protein